MRDTTRAENPSAVEAKLEPGVAWRLLRGSLAGIIAKSTVYPLDRLKMIYQVKVSVVGPFRARLMFNELAHIFRTEGALALWKGNIASLAKHCILLL